MQQLCLVQIHALIGDGNMSSALASSLDYYDAENDFGFGLVTIGDGQTFVNGIDYVMSEIGYDALVEGEIDRILAIAESVNTDEEMCGHCKSARFLTLWAFESDHDAEAQWYMIGKVDSVWGPQTFGFDDAPASI